MTENEYTHMLTLYYSCDYCMCMSFQEFLTRYAKQILEANNGKETEG